MIPPPPPTSSDEHHHPLIFQIRAGDIELLHFSKLICFVENNVSVSCFGCLDTINGATVVDRSALFGMFHLTNTTTIYSSQSITISPSSYQTAYCEYLEMSILA